MLFWYETGPVNIDWVFIYFSMNVSLQIHHVYSTLKRRGNSRFHVVLTWNTRGVFVRIIEDW